MSAVWPQQGTTETLAARASHGAAAPSWTSAPWFLLLLSAVWITLAGNLALWREISALSLVETPGGTLFTAALGLAIAAILFVLGSALAWRWTFKPWLILMLMVSAAGHHFMWFYGISIDAGMLTNVLQTDVHEAADLMSWRFAGSMGVLGVLPSIAVWRWPVRYGRWPQRAARNLALAFTGIAVLGGALLSSYQPLASNWRNHKQLRYLINPLSTVYAAGALAARPLQRPPGTVQPIGLDAHLAAPASRPVLLMLVVGETGRSGNFGLNGYARDTTPELARAGVASFRDAWSCGTSTAASLPCMFSHLGREAFGATKERYENVLDMLQRAGLAVLWVDNQSGCKGVCDRVAQAETSKLDDPMLCDGGQCLDGILLKDLDRRIAALPAEQRARGVVLVLHQMGSHGPAYSERSPAQFKRFQPECTSKDLQQCTTDAIVNAYDNSIAYTDHVLGSAIAWLKTRDKDFDTAMLYLSDHGESLGENNLYLHGLPYAIAPEVQKHVPWITWLSPGFQAHHHVAMACLRERGNVRVSHDNLFHSLLGLAGVQSRLYDPGLDAYAPCAAP